MAPSEEKKSSKRKRRLGKGLSALMGQPIQISANEAYSIRSNPDKTKTTDGEMSGKTENATRTAPLNATNHQNNDNIAGSVIFVSLDAIEPNPNQPRSHMNEEALQSLSQSIRSSGVMQPILVRRNGGAQGGENAGGSEGDMGEHREVKYEIIAGERRWKAARLAGLESIPVVVKTIKDQESAEWAIIENIQREDLNPMEKAEGFLHLIDYYGLTQLQVAEKVGINRSSVANLLRLNQFDQMTKKDIREGRLSQGHAKALLGIANTEDRRKLAEVCLLEDWNVREMELWVRKLLNGEIKTDNLIAEIRRIAGKSRRGNKGGMGSTRGAVSGGGEGKPEHIRMLELELEHLLEMKAEIRLGKSRSSGKVIISFTNVREFEQLLERMKSLLHEQA